MGNATYVRAYVRIPIGPLSVPRSTLLQMRRVRRYTQRKTLEDPEVPPFKTFKGGGKFGSNDIPLVNGGSSEDLLNIHMEIHMPREKKSIPAPLPAYSKEDTYVRTYVRTYLVMVQRFNIYEAPRRLLEGRTTYERAARRVGRPQIGQEWGESTKTVLYHGVVCGLADSESVYVK